jgi:hypothetical protein
MMSNFSREKEELSSMIELQRESMDYAPKDGTVILSDCGTVTYYEGYWYLCDGCGNIPSCAEDGISISYQVPRFWYDLSEVGIKL